LPFPAFRAQNIAGGNRSDALRCFGSRRNQDGHGHDR